MTAVAPGGDEIEVPFPPARLAVGVVWGEIDAVDDLELPGEPVDAIAVGHYLGVAPAGAERALDEAVSRCMLGRKDERLRDDELVITQLALRGTVRGDLAQPFFLPDPRVQDGERDRLLAIAGMGLPGRFGEPELAVVARELCWALGRLRRRHLATVLIGAGAGNLTVTSAVAAWIRGAKLAVTGTEEDGGAQLRRITFVERDPRRLAEIRATILAHRRELSRRNRLKLTYHGVTGKELAGEKFREATRAFERKAWEEWQQALGDDREPAPTRVSLELDGDTYRFGALTPSASVPLREVELDPALVLRANDELVAERDPQVQLERAQFLEKLLIPADLRPSFYTAAPLVMMLDSTTARISWEVLARADAPVALAEEAADSAADEEVELERWYLGTSRGFTRQLRTAFAPPPEPPPPARRLLSVLVVADPAEDEPLAGAQDEGARVAEAFRQFNTVWADGESRVRVVALIGPQEATRTAVLRHLLLRTYDVLHFAGHCTYDPERPLDCGWVFTGGEKLSVRELNRVDRIPRFVFANACESGITPDRSAERHDQLAPSFAEAFFARGVSNFVCTAWPVDDRAASEFALTLYSSLLGLERPEPGSSAYGARTARVMHEAMREARLAIARWPGGTRTWGAYQHYGDPSFRFFDLSQLRQRREQG